MSDLHQVNLPIGYSPCPNDTFIFDAWVNGRLGHEMQPQPQLLDVETLNLKAINAELPVTKLSFAAYAHVTEHYQILSSGAALGNNCGPLVIYRQLPDFSDPASVKVAIPGRRTTANLLFSIFYPDMVNKTEMVFSEIEDAVLNGHADLGLIIHENRFTYAAKGLHKLADLGELWESKFAMPIPLGCIAVLRSLPEIQKKQIGRAIRESVAWAFAHPDDSKEYVRLHAQEMSETVQQQHISLYVNRFSLDLGAVGRAAVRKLFEEGLRAGFLPSLKEPIFAEDE
jgi:1,4-dihydroxy-6-naphthoate synthase